VQAYERYADSKAALAHLQTFRTQFAERFFGIVERRRRFTVYDTPSVELKDVLDRLGEVYLRSFGGFDIWS
jgi:hypothetical protein